MLKAKLKRSKLFSLFISFFILLNLTSCEGFFTDNNLDQKIRAAIDYANAPTSSFWIAADATAGTINPIGKISYKPTDYQNIKFKLKPEYQFIRWNFRYEEIQSSEKYQKEINNQNWWKDYIEIVNEEISEPGSNGEITYSLQIKFIKAEENMLIEPVCALKPILKSWSGQLGDVQSRNGSLSFVFNTKLDLDASIYFSSAELAALGTVTPLTNGLGKVYGYVKDDETFFKNIEIKYKNRSINSSYKDFRYNSDTNTLVIASDSTHTFDIVGDFADIEVIFKEGIKSEAQASMTEAKAYININKYSDDRSVINIVTNTAKNPETVNIVSQNLYLQEQKTATFVESDLTQFLYWEVTSNPNYPDSKDKVYTEIDEENPNKLTYWGMQKIDSTEEVTITAVFEYRPQVVSYTPNSQSVVPKDSDIQINFDEEINLQSFIDGYKISCSGDPVTNYFKTPVLSADKKSIIITADLENRLPIDSNKPITVTVPGSLYYEKTESDGEKYHITLGQDKQLSYTVNTTTRDKAYVQFIVDNSQITIDNFNTTSVKTYSIGDTQTIICNEKAGYQFLGWVKTNDIQNAIQVTKNSDFSYTFKVLKTVGTDQTPVTITANAKERLTASLVSPVINDAGVEKDNDIVIDFNHQPALDDIKDSISIIYNGVILNESSFNNAAWTEPVETTSNGKTVYRLTIPANLENRLNVTGLGTVEIRIDGGLFYTEGQDKVYYDTKGASFKYKINNQTRSKAYIKFEVDSAAGTVKSGGSSFYTTDVKIFNLNEELSLLFEEKSAYQFIEWVKTGDSSGSIQIVKSDTNDKLYTFKIINAAGSQNAPVTIVANAKERLKVSNVQPANTNQGVEKDSSIKIFFNQAPNIELCKQKIAINCSGLGSVKDCFPVSGWTMSDTATSDGYCLTIPASTSNRINNTGLASVTVSFDANLYYLVGTDKIYYGGEGYSYDYKIKNETIDKAKLFFTAGSGQGIITKGTNNDYSIGERIQIEFSPSADYEFLYWQTNNNAVVKFDDKYNNSTNIEILDESESDVTISAVCTAKLKAPDFKIKKGTDNNSIITPVDSLSYPKDSEILITFNPPQNTTVVVDNLKNAIDITCNDVDVYYKYDISLDNSILKFTPKKTDRLQIASEGNVIVRLYNEFYYTYSDSDITKNLFLSGTVTNSFKVNTNTIHTVNVLVQNPSNTECGSITANTGTNSLHIDESFNLNFVPGENYEFICWNLTGTTSNINIDVANKNTIVTAVNSNSGNVTITPYCIKKLEVNNVKVNGSAVDVNTIYNKDSTISVTLDHTLNESQKKYVHLKYKGINLEGAYFNQTLENNNSDNTATITFTPIANKYALVTGLDEYVINIDNRISYPFTYAGISKDIGISDEYNYRINVNQKSSVTHTINTIVLEQTYKTTGAEYLKEENNYAGRLSIPDNSTCYSGQMIEVSFDISSNFVLLDWIFEKRFTDGSSLQSGDSWDNYVRIEESGSNISILINSSKSLTLTIKPRTKRLMKVIGFNANGSSENGIPVITATTTMNLYTTQDYKSSTSEKAVKIYSYYSGYDTEWNWREGYEDITSKFEFHNYYNGNEYTLYNVSFNMTYNEQSLFRDGHGQKFYITIDPALLISNTGFSFDGIASDVPYEVIEINGKNLYCIPFKIIRQPETDAPSIDFEAVFVQEQGIDPDGTQVTEDSFNFDPAYWFYYEGGPEWQGSTLTENNIMKKYDQNGYWEDYEYNDKYYNKYDIDGNPEAKTQSGVIYYYYEYQDLTDCSMCYDITITPILQTVSPKPSGYTANDLFEPIINPSTQNLVRIGGETGCYGIIKLGDYSIPKNTIVRILFSFYDVHMNRRALPYYVYYY